MEKFLKIFFQTDDSLNYLFPRIIVGCVMFPHGAQKLLGWFGGFGFTNTMSFFTETIGLPWVVAFLIIIGESLGSIALIMGFLTRLCSLGLVCIMTGAITTFHWSHGFFANWSGKQDGEGFEYHLLVLGICVPLIIFGGGKYSVDRLIYRTESS